MSAPARPLRRRCVADDCRGGHSSLVRLRQRVWAVDLLSCTRKAFEDWTIDGTRLRSLLGWARPPQEMTPLSSEGFWPRVAARNLHELLGEVPSEFEDGRVPLLSCPIDADLGCAALSVQLVLLEDAVIWENFGWQNNYEPYAQDEDVPPLRFIFDRDAYDSLLRHTLARYAG